MTAADGTEPEAASRGWLARAIGGFVGTGTGAELLRGGAAGVILQVLNKALALGASALFARLLGLEGYGIYAFAVALTGMVSILVELGMGPLALRETARAGGDPGRVGAHLRAAVRLIVVMGVAIGAIGTAVLLAEPIDLTSTERATLLISLPLIVLAPLIRTGAAFLAGLKRLILSQSFEQAVTPLLVAAGAVALYATMPSASTPQIAMLVQVTAGLLAIIALGALLGRYWLASPSTSMAGAELAKRGWPFLMIGSALVLNQQLDTLLVGVILGTAEVGPYRVATQGAQLAMFATFVINSVISPYVARFYADGDRASLHRVFVLARLVATLTVGAALCLFVFEGDRLIRIVFGEEFISASPLLIILTAGYLGNAIAGPCGTILAMTGQERHSARALWIIALSNGIATIAAGLFVGIYGVAIVTACAVTLYQVWLRIILAREVGI